MKEMVGGCCVCSDDRGWPENPLVYCDGQSCTVAVHQACYGIVTVPTGPWYCRKCESQERSVKVKCELCPSKYGALKRTDTSGWAHVVCALYIPEVRFGNVTTMEPIQLHLIPPERINKVCYICEENGKAANANLGACMSCNKPGCTKQFHVTCGQSLGLLCEEAGNFYDNVKYCGYCEYHNRKLKKRGNVKTIPPYKPVSGGKEQSDSGSEKESESAKNSKRKSLNINKTTSTSKLSSSSKTTSGYQKQVSSSSSTSDKIKTTNVKSVKSTVETSIGEGEKSERKEREPETERESKDSGKGKKRKANSRTPTPVSEAVSNTVSVDSVPLIVTIPTQKKDSPARSESSEKTKKVKCDSPPQQIISTTTPHSTATTTTAVTPTISPTAAVAEDSALTPSATSYQIIASQPVNSVVVSVPLHNTTISPLPGIGVQAPVSSPIVVPQQPPPQSPTQEERKTPAIVPLLNTALEENLTTSDMSSGGLNITFEAQVNSTVAPMEIEDISRSPELDVPSKRSRSESTEKFDKTRSKKKNSNGLMNSSNITIKRSSRSQHNTPPPQLTTFVNLPQSSQIKDSPPSSPSSESLGAPPSMGRKKGRKSAPASVSGSSTSINSTKDTKDNIKLFQNGINAPHMLGNQLNLNSNMAQKMSDHLHSELEAHSIFNSNDNNSNLIGPQLHHRVIAAARSSSAGGSSTASGGSGLSSMLSGAGGVIPQTLDQLLERQWEQGSQFLMEQAQHFDIASLLSCLHQLRAENLRLEEHVTSLLQRRDHLLAVNARLAIPLTGPPSTQSTHSHTVNNIHSSVAGTHSDVSRPRHSSNFTGHVQGVSSQQHGTVPMENGISPEHNYPNQHRSPAGHQPQQSPNLIRQSPGGFSSSVIMRQSTESSSRSSSRPPNYSMFQGGPNSQQQVQKQ